MKKYTSSERMYFLFSGLTIILLSLMLLLAEEIKPNNAIEKKELNMKERTILLEEKTDKIKLVEERRKEKEKQEKIKKKKERKKEIEKAKGIAYITIDDGPSKYTKEILDTLESFNVSATFFFIGNNLKKLDKEDLHRLLEGNHTVGAHSMTHDKVKLYKQGKFISENKQVFSELKKMGFQTNLLRAPYGSTYLSDQQIKKIKELDWILLDWTIDSLDWKFKNANKTFNHIKKQLDNYKNKREIIILLHEKPETKDILKKLIPELKERKIVIVSEKERPYKELIFNSR